ncbi:MAG: hypothetical protein PR2021_4650 [Candidatus Phytoplasma pruni]|nr:MAG: hypothetical protein PR2021_4650 [Candidatus Phytoplasma pruni]
MNDNEEQKNNIIFQMQQVEFKSSAEFYKQNKMLIYFSYAPCILIPGLLSFFGLNSNNQKDLDHKV